MTSTKLEPFPFPPPRFNYGNRRQSGSFEFHPVFPVDKRPRELVLKRLHEMRSLTLQDVIVHTTCGLRTLMGVDIAETIVVAPAYGMQPYKNLYCANCQTYFPIDQFKYEESGAPVWPTTT